jgi:membrane protease YdiL (CAAX protease family)
MEKGTKTILGLGFLALLGWWLFKKPKQGTTEVITENPKDTIAVVLQFISYGLILLFVLLAIKQYKFNLIQSEITFGRGVAIGTWVALFLSIILAIYTYFYFSDNPELIEKIKEMSAQSLEENKGMSDSDKEKALEMMGGFMNPAIFAIGAMVNYFIAAFICTLIGAGIQKFVFPYKEEN